MGTISSGVGIFSGIDIEGIVSQLLAIEARPRDQLFGRIEALTGQQTALMTVQARVMAVQLAASNFNKLSIFQSKAVSSSDEDVLIASVSRFAEAASHRFLVKRLASSHHLVSRTFSSTSSPVGNGPISIEIGQGQISRPTDMEAINGQMGFNRGKISITDRAENQAEIDLSLALTMQDVVDTINQNNSVQVVASVSGDHLVIKDESGGTSNLIISEVGAGGTAESLGIAGSVAADQIVGSNIVSVTADTLLSSLNDGNGVRNMGSDATGDIIFNYRDQSGALSVDLRDSLFETWSVDGTADHLSNTLASLNSGFGVRRGNFRITDQNGRFIEIDLSERPEIVTIGQLKREIETTASANGMDLFVNFNGKDHIEIKDNSEPAFFNDDGSAPERRSNFIIEDLQGGHAAADLGILADTSSDTAVGDQIWRMETVGDVINLINNHWDNTAGSIVADINDAGTGLKVADYTSPLGSFSIALGDSSMAGEDLGLVTADESGEYFVGRRLIAGLNSTMLRSLNGGSAHDQSTAGGTISLTDRSGNSSGDIVLANDASVQDLIDVINASGTNIEASLNSVGNGIVLNDTSVDGTGQMVVSGDLADELNIAVAASDNLTSINSGNVQLQYVSEATRLDDLRQGQGIRRGTFTITDGDGSVATVDLNKDSIQTVGDVIDEINNRSTNIVARINDSGDGIILEDTQSTGGVQMVVADQGGYSARDLQLHGIAVEGQNYIDGSYEFKLDIGGGDSIEDIVAAINEADFGVKASIMTAGSGYRISLNSMISGSVGTMYLDAGQIDGFNTQTLSAGQDAIVFYGDGGASNGLLIRSHSNTIENVAKGLTLELNSTSDSPVDVEVNEDLDAIIAQIQSFADAYNEAMDEIDQMTRFDPETLERGLLFSDHTVEMARRSLQSLATRMVPGVSSELSRLSQVGIKFSRLGSESGTNAAGDTVNYAVARTPRLQFDESKFRAAFGADPEGVTELFTKAGLPEPSV